MFRGISAIIKHYEQSKFSGSLRFSISEKEGIRNIDLCEDTTGTCSTNKLPMERLQEICERITFGWISVYFDKNIPVGFDYKINIQGMSYKKLERECKDKCSIVKIAVRKSNT